MKQIRVHGQERRYHHTLIGINGRMDTMQAAILLEKLAIFPREIEQRSACAKVYTELIQNHDDGHLVNVPFVKEGNTSVFAQYTVEVNDREKVIAAMQEDGIPTAVHYPVPLHKQPALADEKVSCPVSEKISEKVMSLPMHPYLKREEQVKVIDALLRAIGGK